MKGERPIVAFIGKLGDMIAIQFVESNSKVVGKKIIMNNFMNML
jgi:hypothetical protein